MVTALALRVTSDGADAVPMKEFACGDVVPGCSATFLGSDDGSILEQVGRHADRDHALPEVGPELVAAVREKIRPAA
jgi:predicted small metal-binding protein